jgi:hypothetical protein
MRRTAGDVQLRAVDGSLESTVTANPITVLSPFCEVVPRTYIREGGFSFIHRPDLWRRPK